MDGWSAAVVRGWGYDDGYGSLLGPGAEVTMMVMVTEIFMAKIIEDMVVISKDKVVTAVGVIMAEVEEEVDMVDNNIMLKKMRLVIMEI